MKTIVIHMIFSLRSFLKKYYWIIRGTCQQPREEHSLSLGLEHKNFCPCGMGLWKYSRPSCSTWPHSIPLHPLQFHHCIITSYSITLKNVACNPRLDFVVVRWAKACHLQTYSMVRFPSACRRGSSYLFLQVTSVSHKSWVAWSCPDCPLPPTPRTRAPETSQSVWAILCGFLPTLALLPWTAWMLWTLGLASLPLTAIQSKFLSSTGHCSCLPLLRTWTLFWDWIPPPPGIFCC